MRKMKLASLAAAVLVFVLVASFGAGAADLTAHEILDGLEGETTLAGSGSATIELTTINRRGQQRSNQLQFYRQETPEGARQLIEFLTPADVAGTKFLSLDEDGETNMWLYLPALGRERRIAGSATQESFMGTDFTFEEIGGAGDFALDYTGERLADETWDGKPTYVLRLTPADPDSAYSFVKMWVWHEPLFPLRIEFYNARQQLEKVLINEDVRQNDGGQWLPHIITMSNELSGTKTVVRLLNIDDGAVPDDYFTLRYLRR